jgi:uncharacterized damage-inducible protein DinB
MWSPRSTRIAVTFFTAAMLCLGGGAAAQDHAHANVAMPQSGFRAELIRDIDQLEKKYLALAEATTASYGWRPAEGVRSTSEVLMHVAQANFMIPAMALGIDPPAAIAAMERGALERITDPAQVHEHLSHSFRHLRHSIAQVPDAELDAEVSLFGQPASKRAVLTLLVSHLHEHLGQAIAYARMNGVAPPWSEGN